MNDYIARFRVNDFEKQELKEHIREVQKLAAAMGKRVDLRRTVNGDSPLLMRLQDENRLTDYEQVKVAFFKDLQITEQEIEQLFKKSVEEIKLLILKSSTGSEAKNKRKSNFVYLSVHPTN